jgi:membrane protease subunit HflK
MPMDNGESPWGKKRQGPPTPDELMAALINKIKEAFASGGSGGKGGSGGNGGESFRKGGSSGLSGKLVSVAMVILTLSLLSASFFTIKPNEKGVVLRFGKFQRTVDPGLHFKVPMVDEVFKVDVMDIRKEEFGFRTTAAAQRSQFTKQGMADESLMLTGDKNVIDVEWIVQYKIKDPVAYLFRVGNVSQAVRDISEAMVRRIVGNMDFDFILGNRDLLANQSLREMQRELDRYGTGVDLIKLQLQDVNPPDQVKPAFNEVNEADQDMKRSVNEAEEAYNREIPKARGTAKQIAEEAQGYSAQRLNKAKGETSRFVAILKEYQRAREVTRRRMYLEAMQEVLPQVTEIYVVDKEQKTLLPLLDLGKGAAARKTN